jgi:hypothetical protein
MLTTPPWTVVGVPDDVVGPACVVLGPLLDGADVAGPEDDGPLEVGALVAGPLDVGPVLVGALVAGPDVVAPDDDGADGVDVLPAEPLVDGPELVGEAALDDVVDAVRADAKLVE